MNPSNPDNPRLGSFEIGGRRPPDGVVGDEIMQSEAHNFGSVQQGVETSVNPRGVEVVHEMEEDISDPQGVILDKESTGMKGKASYASVTARAPEI
ncbi:hypothetical protein V6N13_114568 [Hibiscus sabdariffa]|uniref:Uncharacterized protein n=1 Tax=Hibiscus sabdariffa TaxID=183260 RepID=A0ABR2U300_9ROSI